MRRNARLLAAAPLGLAAALIIAAPASAAPDPGAAYLLVWNPGDIATFGTASKTDAGLRALPQPYAPLRTEAEPKALEIIGDTGYALAPEWIGADFTIALQRWSPDTGALLASTTITFDDATLPFTPGWDSMQVDVDGLDSPDGATLQTVACLDVSYPDDGARACLLGTLDLTTAAFTPTVDVSTLREAARSRPNELATDPLTGITWLFFDRYDPAADMTVPYAAAVDGTTVGSLIRMTGLETVAGGGSPLGADFAGDGTFWLGYADAGGEQLLMSFTPGFTPTVTAIRVGTLAPADASGPVVQYQLATLAVASWATPVAGDPDTSPAAAELAATGVEGGLGGAVLAGALLAAGGLALALRRRIAPIAR